MRKQERPAEKAGGDYLLPSVSPSSFLSPSSPSRPFGRPVKTAWLPSFLWRRLSPFSLFFKSLPSGLSTNRTIEKSASHGARLLSSTACSSVDETKNNTFSRKPSRAFFSSSSSSHQSRIPSHSSPVLPLRFSRFFWPLRFLPLFLFFLLGCFAAIATLVYFLTLPSRVPPLLTSSSLPFIVSRPPGETRGEKDVHHIAQQKRVSSGAGAGELVSYFLPFDDPPFGVPRERPSSAILSHGSYSLSSFSKDDLETATADYLSTVNSSVPNERLEREENQRVGKHQQSNTVKKEFLTAHLLHPLYASPPRRLYSSTTIQVGPPADYSGFSFEDLWSAFKSSPQEYFLLLWFLACFFMFCLFCSWLCRQRSFQKAVLVSP
ncbi:transmembrane protein [Cystoisospora suis]|uniref:Transmembrane protein n=1 Tax=Cystoisospora suis TaxID=483139 RepID=A0A2C6LAU2_9APIC|nr:transmembrane protein [Cystoisospora suis]